MIELDEVIGDLFATNWTGAEQFDVELAKKQLAKNLRDQVNGFWSGHTAYWIITNGGFLIDSKKGTKKKLTAVGKIFLNNMEMQQEAGNGKLF
jgi:SRSO17 transposase